MISIKRAAGDDFQYPCSRELTMMKKRLVEYYSMLRNRSAASGAEWESVKKQLLKKIQNVTTPKKKQKLLRAYRTRRDIIKLYRRCTKPRPDPTRRMFPQLQDLEFQARRAFIDSDTTKEQDRPTKILQAYPCFRELDHVMDELRRILDRGNSRFIPELKTRWGTFYNQAQFYGVFKKVMKPPLLDKVKHSIAMMKTLPDMFPSPVSPPKKLGHASEAMLHILESAEDPNNFLQARPLFSPVVTVCETICILAIGTCLC
ncbi:uncharacterized protein [Salmo salar]|uniref:Uncharacterized protein n=1 Tax=Salmo salar TaxID=8030 RepID=A0A1S3MRE5_SALSA|nr:uncharacterized protein LOC106574380 [Salmo salar]|eukprot:XP_014005709.1 PREDICTED: uncharacterized protein LOC106574380 isoform X1 [Salmo salar]